MNEDTTYHTPESNPFSPLGDLDTVDSNPAKNEEKSTVTAPKISDPIENSGPFYALSDFDAVSAGAHTAPAKDDLVNSTVSEERKTVVWKKYAVVAGVIAAVVALIFIVASLSNKEPTGNYYTQKQARDVLTGYGYNLGELIWEEDADSDYKCAIELVTEEFKFLTVSGYIEFSAKLASDTGEWVTYYTPYVSYDWKLSGSWFADTEDYDVYMDIKSYSDSKLHLVLEAQYDSTSGGKGSYGEQEQTVTLKLIDNSGYYGFRISDICLQGYVSGGYPQFELWIYKDAMKIKQGSDSYTAEFVPN